MIEMDNGIETKSFSDFNMIVEQGYDEPIIPTFSHLTTSVPQRVGMLKFGQKIESKPFNLPILIHDNDWIDRQQAFNELAAFLFDDQGKSRQIKIILDYERDKYYTFECNGMTTPSRWKNFARFEVQFIAYDPYKYSVVSNDEVTWGSEVITFESHAYTLGHENASAEFVILNNQIINIDVMGLALSPIIKIEGSATNLVIENAEKQIVVGTFNNANWIIDTDKYIAYLNGDEKIIRIDKDWMLRHGKNNIQFAGSNLNLKVTIRFRDRWQ